MVSGEETTIMYHSSFAQSVISDIHRKEIYLEFKTFEITLCNLQMYSVWIQTVIVYEFKPENRKIQKGPPSERGTVSKENSDFLGE